MFETPALREKRRRMEIALKMLKGRKSISEKCAIAVMEYNYGLAKRTAQDYINTFVNMGALKRIKTEENGRDSLLEPV